MLRYITEVLFSVNPCQQLTCLCQQLISLKVSIDKSNLSVPIDATLLNSCVVGHVWVQSIFATNPVSKMGLILNLHLSKCSKVQYRFVLFLRCNPDKPLPSMVMYIERLVRKKIQISIYLCG